MFGVNKNTSAYHRRKPHHQSIGAENRHHLPISGASGENRQKISGVIEAALHRKA